MSDTFFPDPPPSPAASEPPVWIRRLVLLRQIEPEVDIIREVPFDLGLNLIVTKQPPADSNEALGHDVGKTLLTRLIRYILGEARYADGRTRTAIRRALPDSIVAGEFRVDGENWAVMRPLGAPSTFVARAARVSGWSGLLDVPGTVGQYESFVQAVSDVVLDPITSPLLTHARRPIEWLDVLAWIARDQRCRYSHPLVWRHADTDSGTSALLTEDASIVLRSVSGLMDAREKKLFEEHDDLLQQRQKLADEVKLIEAQLAAEEGSVTADLRDLLQTQDVGISELELEMIRSQAQKLEDLRQDEIRKLNVADLRRQYEEAYHALAKANASEKSLGELIRAVSAHIRDREERPRTVYEQFAALCDRPVDDCPAKMKIAQQKVPTPDEQDLAELRSELEDHKRRQKEMQDSKPELATALDQRRAALRKAEQNLLTVTAGIDGRVALYRAMARRVERHLQRTARLPQAAKEQEELNTKINQSRERQAQLREALTGTRAWLPMRFAALCKEFVGGSRQFELGIESKAIRLNIVGSTGAPGEATSTSALVLSLDLAAIQAAIDGYGHHPRFIVLDSPREADMEIGIFNRMMRRLASWHQASPEPVFQMIVTTTTRPHETDVPADLVRLELARVPEDKLLLGMEL